MAKLTFLFLAAAFLAVLVSAQPAPQQPEFVEIKEEVPSGRVKRWGYGPYGGPYGGGMYGGGYGPYGGHGTTVIKKVIIHRPGYGGYGGGYGPYGGGMYGGGWGSPYFG
ncbi:hypothetical protein L596_004242 [Steinernema carpocapsae]|uniref:Uncharacterized protein n=1 Tax=Steinernema carpocapsae TaxID=34508 RepID=A0A4U8UV66_STECR|nr:hypothetical protein L596_004242 [Steinernema carpocapsae]